MVWFGLMKHTDGCIGTYDVSINYLVTGNKWFPSLRRLKRRDAEKILDEIEILKPEIEL